jgi:hypothetical protein
VPVVVVVGVVTASSFSSPFPGPAIKYHTAPPPTANTRKSTIKIIGFAIYIVPIFFVSFLKFIIM